MFSNTIINKFIFYTKLFNMDGNISSNARCPTVECRLSNVLAAACLTDGKGSANARLNNLKITFISQNKNHNYI